MTTNEQANEHADPTSDEALGIKRGEYRKMDLYDFVRRDIERISANPLARSKELKPPPEFVRNVWGSSAGVGSGDFHVYRGVRRREYARLESIEQSAEEKRQQELDEMQLAKTLKRKSKRDKKKNKRKALGGGAVPTETSNAGLNAD